MMQGSIVVLLEVQPICKRSFRSFSRIESAEAVYLNGTLNLTKAATICLLLLISSYRCVEDPV